MNQPLFISLIILLTIGLIPIASGQLQLVLLSAENGQPIEGVIISAQSVNDQQSASGISDIDGLVSINLKAPIAVHARHLAYSNHKDTLHSSGFRKIYMHEHTSKLEDVVVTGQYAPQSAKNSVYSVRTISAERIQALGATSLQDVLSNELNIRFSRDNALGSSSVTLQGLSGQNIKVLIDGVPVIGRSGVDNEIDLNQINPNHIERIEIVEGPMAVSFGADALAGTFNIITKKDIDGKLSLDVGIQEETIGKEYSLFADGIHSYSTTIGYNVLPVLYAQVQSRLNKSGGWTGVGDGRNKSWFPKNQQFISGLIRFHKNNANISYKLDGLNERISNLGPIIEIEKKDSYAFDTVYNSRRIMQQLDGEISIGSFTINPVISLSNYERTTNRYKHVLITGDTENTDKQDTIKYKTLFFRNTLNDKKRSWGKNTIQWQTGIDGDINRASGTSLNDGNKHLTNLGFFGSFEYEWGSKIAVRPGVRFTHNSNHRSTPTPSLHVKLKIADQSQIRVAYGRGYRAPSIRELYHEFVDANHNILGNENLKPERSHNLNLDISTQLKKYPVKLSIAGFYNHVTNQITFFTPVGTSTQSTTYNNLLKFKTTGGSFNSTYKSTSLKLDAGLAYTGRYQRLSESEDIPQFVFSPEARANAQYDFSKYGLSLSVFYKYNGKSKSYQTTTVDGENIVGLARVEDYHFLDTSIAKSWGTHTAVRIGTRNLLNVTSVNSNVISDNAHGGSGTQRAIAYGRSYFIQLKFHINQI